MTNLKNRIFLKEEQRGEKVAWKSTLCPHEVHSTQQGQNLKNRTFFQTEGEQQIIHVVLGVFLLKKSRKFVYVRIFS